MAKKPAETKKPEPAAAEESPKVEVGPPPEPVAEKKKKIGDLPGKQTFDILTNRSVKIDGVLVPAETKIGELTTDFGLSSTFVAGGINKIAYCKPKE